MVPDGMLNSDIRYKVAGALLTDNKDALLNVKVNYSIIMIAFGYNDCEFKEVLVG